MHTEMFDNNGHTLQLITIITIVDSNDIIIMIINNIR